MSNDIISDNPFQKSNHSDFYKALLDDMVTFVAVLDKTGNIIFVNNTPLIAAGITLDEIKGTKFWDAAWWAYSDKAIDKIRKDAELCASGESLIHQIQLATADKTLIWIEYSMHPILDENGEVEYLIPEGRDITEHKKQEDILRRTQKMEALGQLTGGIAHDYNNLLGIIQGFSDLLTKNLMGEPKLMQYVNRIRQATKRGSKLTRKLLAFTRQTMSEVKTCDINNVVTSQKLILEKTLTPKVNLTFNLEKNIWPIDIDENDLEDSLLNITINAMHAMQDGGSLIIRTENQNLEAVDAKALEIKAGAYVVLSIADTGCGMAHDTLSRVFDPFFSTKGDKGTGLGMSQVLGFIKRSNGTIKIYSDIGKGTRVLLYFPRSDNTIELGTITSSMTPFNLSGDETVLIVDDEPSLAEYATELLLSYGYHTLVAHSAKDALTILARTRVDLVVTDVVMPIMDGYELSSIIRKNYPEIKIQIVSGFEDGRYNEADESLYRKNILYKPYTSHKLLTHVRTLLDEKNGSDASLKDCNVLIMDDDESICKLFQMQLKNLGCQSVITHNGNDALSYYQDAYQKGDKINAVILDLSTSHDEGGVDVARKIREINKDETIILCSADMEDDRMLSFTDYGFDGVLEKPSNIKAIKKVLTKNLIND